MSSNEKSLQPKDFPAPGHDLRQEARLSHHRWIEVLPAKAIGSEWHFIRAELCDCSTSGLCILLDSPMAVGEQFLVKFKFKGVSLLMYTVRHCSATTDRRFRIGAEFVCLAALPHEADRQAILDALLSPE